MYIYTRVSTAMQIDGYSLETQRTRMTAFAEFNNYEIASEYEDASKSVKSIEGRKIDDQEQSLFEAKAKKQSIEVEKVTSDNIYKILIYFEMLYSCLSEEEQRQLMESLISEIQIYEERQANGQWLKSITFRMPIIEANMHMPVGEGLDNDNDVETVALMSKRRGNLWEQEQ